VRKLILVALLTTGVAANSEPCFGPGGCVNPEQPVGPTQFCMVDSCQPVVYSWSGDYAIAQSSLTNGYPVAGLAGPCFNQNRGECPDIFNQAFAMLKTRALEAHRAQRY